MKHYLFFAAVALALVSCNETIICSDSHNTGFRLVGYDSMALSTITFREYAAQTSFSRLRDTFSFRLADSYNRRLLKGDTLDLKDKLYAKSDSSDWEIVLPVIGCTIRVTEIMREPQHSKTVRGGFNKKQEECYNLYQSYKVNGEQKAVGDDQLLYIHR